MPTFWLELELNNCKESAWGTRPPLCNFNNAMQMHPCSGLVFGLGLFWLSAIEEPWPSGVSGCQELYVILNFTAGNGTPNAFTERLWSALLLLTPVYCPCLFPSFFLRPDVHRKWIQAYRPDCPVHFCPAPPLEGSRHSIQNFNDDLAISYNDYVALLPWDRTTRLHCSYPRILPPSFCRQA